MNREMYRLVIFVMACQPLTNAEGLRDQLLPWRTRFARQIHSEESTAENVCKLPPYPERGRYLVMDELGAKPGDVFLENVSLIQYEIDDSVDTFKVNTMSCSSGNWSENAFQYESDKLYFDSSWCSTLCSHSEIDNATASDSNKQYKERTENTTTNRICKIPPYPEGDGSYFHPYLPNLKPGDTFESINLYYYMLDVSGVYEIKSLSCIKGLWIVRLFHKGALLRVKKKSLCAIACTSPVAEKTSEPRSTPTIQELNSPFLPWRSTLAESSDAGDMAEPLCELPPYPQRGKYVVVNAPGAKPGDIYPNVSFVEYIYSENNESVEIKAKSCSSGRWTQSIFQYASENLYFNNSWCPLLCSSFGTDNVTETVSENVNETNKTEEDNMTKRKLCEIPPYPEHGGYYLQDRPSAGPGYVAEYFLGLYRYVIDGTNGIRELKKLTCNQGTWFITVLEVESGSLRLNRKTLCPLLCSSSDAKEFSSATRAAKPPKVLNSPHLPWRSVFEEGAVGNTKEQVTSEMCELPPYPENGAYMALNPPDARPGDAVESASLVQYTSVNDNHVEIRAMNCSFGQWSEIVFQSLSSSIYFDTAWCPYLCLPADVDVTSEGTKQKESINVDEIPCKLPPYPPGGSYYVHGFPGARPGDVFNRFVISMYVPEEDGRFYRIEELRCRYGDWSRKLFRMEGNRIFFHKKMWCPLLCRIFRNSST